VGRVEEVLVEKEGRRGGVQGRTESNKVVNFAGPASLIGTFAEVRLTSTTGATFAGELVGAAEPAGIAA
jgi:tRNA-2-methylthio-N6-dimethylallyladenosine synthase